MRTEEQIRERLSQWREKKQERLQYKQDTFLESCMIAAFEWVLQE